MVPDETDSSSEENLEKDEPQKTDDELKTVLKEEGLDLKDIEKKD